MSWAAVPEAPIDEYGDTFTVEDKVWSTHHALIATPTVNPFPSKQLREH